MSESPHPNVTVNSILQLNVDSFEEKFINNKSETVYTINIKNLYNKKKWTIEKTYRDIEMLHSELSKIYFDSDFSWDFISVYSNHLVHIIPLLKGKMK